MSSPGSFENSSLNNIYTSQGNKSVEFYTSKLYIKKDVVFLPWLSTGRTSSFPGEEKRAVKADSTIVLSLLEDSQYPLETRKKTTWLLYHDTNTLIYIYVAASTASQLSKANILDAENSVKRKLRQIVGAYQS